MDACQPKASVLKPCNCAPSTRTVLTDFAAAAAESTRSTRANMEFLWGKVQFHPRKPASFKRGMVIPKSSAGTSIRRYSASNPKTENPA